jgi:hypothetical protein
MTTYEELKLHGVTSLNACRVHSLESNSGERGYLLQLGTPGSRINLLASVVEMEHLRQQIESATLAGMFG